MTKWQEMLVVALVGALVALTLGPVTGPAALRAVCGLLPAEPAVAAEAADAQSALKWFKRL